MGALHRGLRAELAAILDVDQYTLQELVLDPPAPTEATTVRLANLIVGALTQKESVRTVYQFLPILMLRIFGYAAGHGWLETLCELPSKDREPMLRLIAPDGPLHTFCKRSSTAREDKVDIASDMRFEFLRSNLPSLTDKALETGTGAALRKSVKDGPSYLAHFLESSLQDRKDHVLYLTPLDYFILCMVASPTRKYVAPMGGFMPGGRKPRRSSSLPSTRALYNQTVASYASSLKGPARVDSNSFFIAACLDYWFFPWASASSSEEVPPPSTATAEAVASVMLALAPSNPSTLDLVVDFRPSGIPEFLDWRMQTNTSALYRAAESMLESVLTLYESAAPASPLVVYLRILALYVTPWRGSIRNALAMALFPKKKSNRSGNYRSTSISALTSTLSSINSHLVSPNGSPGNITGVKEGQWRAELRVRRKFVDDELLRLAIVKAVNNRLPSLPEGGNVLALLSEAVTVARIVGSWESPDKDQDLAEELRVCLLGLRNQKMEYERQSGRRERNYVAGLSASMGIRLNGGGMLSGISEMVAAGGSAGVAGVVSMVSGGSMNGSAGKLTRRRLHEKRQAFLKSSGTSDIPFLGNVWERPIASGENEFVVLWLYWLALRAEPRLGYVPNLRFLGRFWLPFCISVILCFLYVVRGFLLSEA